MPRLTRNTSLGIAASVLALAVIAWSLAGKPTPFGSSASVVRAEFRDVSSLIRFDRDVRLGGVDVGTIGKVQRTGDTARVELELDPDVARTIRADASAELRPHTLFDGNSFIELDPGSPSAPPLGDRIIPLSRTRNYVTLDKALRVLDTPTRTALQETVGGLADTLRPSAVPPLRATITRLPQLMQRTARWTPAVAGPHRTELRGAVRGLARTVAAVAAARTAIPPLVRSTAATVRAVDAPDPALARALERLPGTLATTRRGSRALHRTLVALRPVAGGLVPVMHGLGPTLGEARPVLRRLGPALARSRPFFADLRATLDAGGRAATPARRRMVSLLPTLDLLRGDLIPYLLSRAPAGGSVIDGLGALGAGAAGVLSSLNTTRGVGHLWTAKVSSPALVSCAGVPQPALQQVLSQLKVCTP